MVGRPNRKAKVLALADEGWACAAIARQTGISKSTVSRWCRQRPGFTWGRKGNRSYEHKYSPSVRSKARELAREHKRVTVSRLMGIPETTLDNWARAEGWKFRKKQSQCSRCPHRPECSQYKLHPQCEREIEVLGQPESKLWANHGGREVWEEVYG